MEAVVAGPNLEGRRALGCCDEDAVAGPNLERRGVVVGFVSGKGVVGHILE